MDIKHSFKEEDIVLRDVRGGPFDIYGLYNPKSGTYFKRMPDNVAAAVNDGVAFHAKHTAGGRVRFTTDSSYIAIKAVMPEIFHKSHMTLLGTSGFDLYINEGGRDIYKKSFMPPFDMEDGYEALINLGERVSRSVTIHFPLYNRLDALYIGLQADASLESGAKYAREKPVLYYGSSITQGGCASRPGNAYPNIISAKLNSDHINLGFSGSARGEDTMADYLASLDFSVFVYDYDHNSPSVEHLKNTHEKLFLKIREAHPDTPVIFVTKPDFDDNPIQSALRRDVISRTYINALNKGDKNVYFIDGESLFAGYSRDLCTVDSCHPNDAGFLRIAEAVSCKLARILSL